MSFETPESLSEFFERLAAGAFPAYPEGVPADFNAFRREAEARHAAGEDIFGDEYLRRNNPAEGCEEGSDGANYSCYDHLRWKAETGEGDDPALALLLTAAHHFYLAHKALSEVPGKRAGEP